LKRLVSAQVVQKSDGGVDVSALVSGLSIILSAEFIMKVVNFFLDALNPVEPETKQPVADQGKIVFFRSLNM